MTRHSRRFAAFFAAFALAFAQFAVSAYACPGMPMDKPAVDAAAACDDAATPNLCERHCDYGSTSVQASAQAAFAVAIAPAALRVDVVDTARASTPIGAIEPFLARRIERPPLERFGFLRI